ncbi:MAG: DUF364 domain-containing protein [Candidatus Thiodiazotropha sp. DIVDIV]
MNSHDPWLVYQMLLNKLPDIGEVEEVLIGLTWTLARGPSSVGLAMSPGTMTRVLPWSGTLRGRDIKQLATWVKSWNQYEATVGMACINAVLNSQNRLAESATPLFPNGPANLSVFEYFRPELTGKKVVTIGRYPGIESLQHDDIELIILERDPAENDLPDPAAEYVLRDADWVFLSATTLINKTFPRLAELAGNSKLVLMGPTTPWVKELADFGIDYLAGVQVVDSDYLRQTVSEGGGTRIFETGVRYAVTDLHSDELTRLKDAIGTVVAQREQLKGDMEAWYQSNSRSYPQKQMLLELDQQLSILDTHYKQRWDAWQNPTDLKSLPMKSAEN